MDMNRLPGAISLAITMTISSIAFGQTQPINTAKTGYASVNGLKLYYEVQGEGEPLILLHGGLGSIEMMSQIRSVLARTHQVIAVDLQAHGRTADIDRPISYEALGDDIAALLLKLGIKQADLMGYSLGAGTALQTTIRHPDLVRRLVVVSTPFKRDGWYPEIRELMSHMGPESAEQMKQSPLYQVYARVAPRPQDWPILVTKMSDLLRRDYDWSKDIAAMKAPTLLVFGDADSIPVSHAAEFFELLGGSKKDGGWDGSGITKARLSILPGATHYNILSSPALVSTVESFLDSSRDGNSQVR